MSSLKKRKKREVLIVKTGYSEFLDRGLSITVSFGDVLMCTAILHLFRNDRVTWVTSQEAKPILAGNPYVDRLLVFGPETIRTVTRSSYDVLINLEKDIGICASLCGVRARKRYGFYFDVRKGNITSYKKTTRFLLAGQENQTDIHDSGLEILFDAVGARWKGEGFILERRHRRKEKYDVGLNYTIGSKWPTKGWPMKHWKKLEALLKAKHVVCWQQGQKNLDQYFDWIDQCRVVVTSDSLGQSVAQALGKQVVTLFGPTNYERMRGLKNIHFVISPLACPYMPCYLPVCKNDRFCMDFIAPEKVAALCERLLK